MESEIGRPAPHGDDTGRGSAAARQFHQVAERVLDAMLEASPVTATELGDHRFDDRLDDLSAEGVERRVAALSEALAALDSVDDAGLTVDDQVDLEILRTAVARDAWLFTELREHETNPLLHLPGDALYPLLAREVGDPATRLRSLAARMAAVPEHLAVARRTLRDLSRVHVETAIGQARGVVAMLGADVDELLAREPRLRPEVDPARAAAVAALGEFITWLDSRVAVSDADPRLGEPRYAAKLWYTLDTETSPDSLLTRAECDLQAIEEELAELAARLDGRPVRPGQVRAVLDRVAASAPVTDETILALCRQALADTTARVRQLDLVTVPEDPVSVIVMPESRRGVAVAYCDPPGALEPPGSDGSPLPTLFAVSPSPGDWPAERVSSFYREYNGHLVRNLTVHEAMPGHMLQLAHANRCRTATRVRAAHSSGTFIEGWAVYAEALMAGAGLGLGDDIDAGLSLQQLKMQLRTTINAILDVRVHARGMTEREAMELMTVRGHQEDGEATGKWRRALLTSTQLSTYYVGYHEVRDLVQHLRRARPDAGDREVHDAVLAHGSPPPRHLRTLLGLGPAPD